jgi:hypothetical protein
MPLSYTSPTMAVFISQGRAPDPHFADRDFVE